MSENSFYEALFRIMWDMEVDVFTQPKRTLALVSDIVPKCRKQKNRLKAMYDCGAMEKIEQAVADRKSSELYLTEAVTLIIDSIEVSEDKALFAVNQIASLWDDINPLKRYAPERFKRQNQTDHSEPDSEDDEDETDDDINSEDGDDMIFLQDMTDEENKPEENTENTENTENSEPGTSEESQPEKPKSQILSTLVNKWCRTDFEDGRPLMAACPVGWFMIIMCSLPGLFMIHDINVSEKFVIPTFLFMFTVLTGKRLYRFESVGRLSIYFAVLYLTAMFKAIWIGLGGIRFVSIPVALAFIIIFNSGRIGTWLDESKKRPSAAYLIIVLLSGAAAFAAYAVQHYSV